MAYTIKDDVIKRLGNLPDKFYCVHVTDNAFPNISTKSYLLCLKPNELIISEMSFSGDIKTQTNIQFSEISQINIMDEFTFRSFSITLKNGTHYAFWANKKVQLKLENQKIRQNEYIDLLTNQLKESLSNNIVIHKQVKAATVGVAGLSSIMFAFVSVLVSFFVAYIVFEKTHNNFIVAMLSGIVVFGVLKFALKRIIDFFYSKVSSQYKSDSKNPS